MLERWRLRADSWGNTASSDGDPTRAAAFAKIDTLSGFIEPHNLYAMSKFDPIDEVRSAPEQWIKSFYERLSRDIAGSEPAADVIDRYHTADAVQISDGVVIDRARLIDHVAPMRKQGLRKSAVTVHEAIASDAPDGTIVAARLTMSADLRKRAVVTRIHLFTTFAHDGRMRRAHLLTCPVDKGADKGADNGG